MQDPKINESGRELAGAGPTPSVPAPDASGVSLASGFDLTDRGLVVHVKVVNSGGSAILVLDKLWDLDRSSKLVPDAQAVYRFVGDGVLRLLLGVAPPPASKAALYRNVPYVTRVEPRSTLEYDLTLTTPVAEHNPYFPPSSDVFTTESVTSVELFVQYIVVSPDVKAAPSPFLPGALTLATPGVWDRASTLRSGTRPLSVPTLRRTDEFARWSPPGASR